MLIFEDVHFRYGRVEVLRGIDLKVSGGEFVGIVGPNGVGKSTLIKLACGVLTASLGQIKVADNDIEGYSAKELARLVAVLPQEVFVPFDFTAFEIVLMGRAPYVSFLGFESAYDLEVARMSMERTDTWHLRDRPLVELSGGEKRRVLFARALAQQSKLLLLDEPMAALDVKHQMELFECCAELVCEGVAIIAAVHDINMAAAYCSKIYLLREGKVYASGEPQHLITQQNMDAVFGGGLYVGVGKDAKPYCLPCRGGGQR